MIGEKNNYHFASLVVILFLTSTLGIFFYFYNPFPKNYIFLEWVISSVLTASVFFVFLNYILKNQRNKFSSEKNYFIRENIQSKKNYDDLKENDKKLNCLDSDISDMLKFSLIYGRANGKCERCGSREGVLELFVIDKDLKDDTIKKPDNLLVLCPNCRQTAEAYDKHRLRYLVKKINNEWDDYYKYKE
ncbi:MAG: hypothetical protein V5A68_08145 [Candidatus Thermoplasmatota archaeon]